jgi:hypothetical protein
MGSTRRKMNKHRPYLKHWRHVRPQNLILPICNSQARVPETQRAQTKLNAKGRKRSAKTGRKKCSS